MQMRCRNSRLIPFGPSRAPSKILDQRNWLHVAGVYAGLVSTKMINHKVIGDWPHINLIKVAMGETRPMSGGTQFPIGFMGHEGTLPVPASRNRVGPIVRQWIGCCFQSPGGRPATSESLIMLPAKTFTKDARYAFNITNSAGHFQMIQKGGGNG